MKFRNLRKKVATFGVVSALTVLCLGYQNCSRPHFAIDEAMKDKVMGETPVFGDERDPGVDPGGGMPSDPRDPGVDPGGGGPRDPALDPVTGMPRDPALDPVTGTPRDPALDPVTGMPRDPALDPVTGTPRDPALDPVTGTPPRDSGTDPNAPKPPKGSTGGKKTVAKFEFMCPLGVQAHGAYKPLVEAGELKAVIETKAFSSGATVSVCEIADIRAQLLASHSLDISKCYDGKDSFVNQTYLYIVEKTVTSNYAKYNIAMDDTPFSTFLPTRIGYAEMDDKANLKGCDVVGDPLLVQLKNNGQPQPISLTSAASGVMFDLLGLKNKYQKVQTAWFAETRSENYFLVLPDAKGDVKGIDQLFGDNTLGPIASRPFAKQGFEALAKHDENKDQVISDEDIVFSSLRLWKDDNLDGIAQKSEMFTLDEKGVVAIDIKIDRKERKYLRTDSHGNMTKYRSIVVMKDGQYGLVYDLWLTYIMK